MVEYLANPEAGALNVLANVPIGHGSYSAAALYLRRHSAVDSAFVGAVPITKKTEVKIMKLYRVRAVSWGYDEYDSFLVWANNPGEALELCIAVAGEWCGHCNFSEGASIYEERAPTKPGVALSSFNAG